MMEEKDMAALRAERQRTINRLGAEDDFGRGFGYISGFRKDRYVGMFYFLWHGQHKSEMPGVYNVSELEKNDLPALLDTGKNPKSPVGAFHHWGKPLFGYYNSEDPWVLRKHMELLCIAGIDFICFDCTNAREYWEVLEVLLPVMQEMYDAGWNVPKFMFYLNTCCDEAIARLYYGSGKGCALEKEGIYKKGLFKDLWFMPGGKPKIAAVTEEGNTSSGTDAHRVRDKEILSFFDFWESQWPNNTFYENGFPWIEWSRPQPVHTQAEAISVSIAQHNLCPFSDVLLEPGIREKMWGRGYTSRSGADHSERAIISGANFEEEWQTALEKDVKYTFVTGWNEWAAIKFVDPYRNCIFLVDNFNLEFSRDIEMMEDGYEDNPYLQLMRNVRKLKGLQDELLPSPMRKIDFNDVSCWKQVEDRYIGFIGQTPRDFAGFAPGYHYKDDSRRLEICEIRAAHDEKFIYFNIVADRPLAPADGDEAFMNVLVGIDGSENKGFRGFEYLIGRGRTDSACSVEFFGKEGPTKCGQASFKIERETIVYRIPETVLKIKGSFTLRFKVADNVKEPMNMQSYYASGCVAPIGRLGFIFRG